MTIARGMKAHLLYSPWNGSAHGAGLLEKSIASVSGNPDENALIGRQIPGLSGKQEPVCPARFYRDDLGDVLKGDIGSSRKTDMQGVLPFIGV